MHTLCEPLLQYVQRPLLPCASSRHYHIMLVHSNAAVCSTVLQNGLAYQVPEQIAPKLSMQLMSDGSMWAFKPAVPVQRPQRQIVDVEPDWASPVWSVMLGVIRPMHTAALTQRPTDQTLHGLVSCWQASLHLSHC